METRETKEIIWHTTLDFHGERDIKQHAYYKSERGPAWEDKYEGNRCLCNKKRGVHDGEVFVKLESMRIEDYNPDRACKSCIKIVSLSNKTH